MTGGSCFQGLIHCSVKKQLNTHRSLRHLLIRVFYLKLSCSKYWVHFLCNVQHRCSHNGEPETGAGEAAGGFPLRCDPSRPLPFDSAGGHDVTV